MGVLTSWIVPSLGCFLSIVRHFIATGEVLAVRSGQHLGDLNPLPFAATILNCSGWVVYTVLVRNWFVFISDVPGLLCSIWMTFSLYPYASPSVQNQLNAFIVLAALLWCVLAAATMVLQEHSTQPTVVALWGWTVSVTQVLLMASPLSGLLRAIQQRSSANFHLGVCAMGLLSSSLWAIYAMTIMNLFIAIPNFLGGLLSCASLLVCFIFPRKPAATPAQQEADNVRAAVNAVQMG
ncbi:g5398 [Coccomyxa viridis]|uniref:Bidirectional sugar transporter SWEET n=1 Tax=Coccomyxa viridis TaxID=1274662 RepID=A0ABP1FZF2_9CHLO